MPLILTTDTYLDFDRNRHRLFGRLEDLAREYPIIFIGTSLSDHHIKALLARVDADSVSRPMYYFVSPFIIQYEESLLMKKRITAVKCTFENFMSAANTELDSTDRKLAGVIGPLENSIEQHFRRNVRPSPSLIAFLSGKVEHVRVGMPSSPVTPDQFYKGVSHSWSPIEQNLDIERRIYETAILRILALGKVDKASVDIVAARGVAGAGKSVFARRLAWDLATKFDQLVLFASAGANLRPDPLLELHDLTGKKVVLVVDQAADSIRAVTTLIDRLESSNVPLICVLADTQAAFGASLEELAGNLRFRFDIRDLDEAEIRALLEKLERNNCLGLLQHQSKDERFVTFSKLAQKQLLVALYEATQGKPLEEIVLEEYHRIVLSEAQELYLLVCTLNQFRVPVRAGLIRRLTDVSFDDFKRRLLGPLDGMIFGDSMNPAVKDYEYRARHPHIAEIVFRRVLDTHSKQVSQYLRVIDAMNTTYSTDNEALRRMVSWRNIKSLTSSLDEARRIYELAAEVTNDDAYVLQQQAHLEMNSNKGDLLRAREKLDQAQSLRPKDRTLMHSRASLLVREASKQTDPLIRKSIRGEARALLRTLKSEGASPYVSSLAAQLAVDELTDVMQNWSDDTELGSQPQMVRLIEDAESEIRRGLTYAPDFQALTQQSFRLAKLIGEDARAEKILAATLSKHPHLEFIAITFARSVAQRDMGAALAAIKTCLGHKPNSKPLNQALFDLMVIQSDDFRDELEGPLRKSFTDGDGNIYMHIHAVRYYYMRADRAKYQQALSAAKSLSHDRFEKHRPRLVTRNPAVASRTYRGEIVSLGAAFAFVIIPGLLDRTYIDPSGCQDESIWERLGHGAKVDLELHFNVHGPVGRNVSLVDR